MKASGTLVVILLLIAGALAFTSLTPPEQSNTAPTLSELDLARQERIRTFAATWSADPDFENRFNALTPSKTVTALVDTPFDPADDYWGLPRDNSGAHELVAAYCAGCHSLSIVMQQRATRAGWKDLLEWMEEKQGMPPLEADEDYVLEYLSKYFARIEQ
jgi:hypothetical protein